MMGKASFSDDFKRDAVAQITERGCRVAEVSKRLTEPRIHKSASTGPRGSRELAWCN